MNIVWHGNHTQGTILWAQINCQVRCKNMKGGITVWEEKLSKLPQVIYTFCWDTTLLSHVQ